VNVEWSLGGFFFRPAVVCVVFSACGGFFYYIPNTYFVFHQALVCKVFAKHEALFCLWMFLGGVGGAEGANLRGGRLLRPGPRIRVARFSAGFFVMVFFKSYVLLEVSRQKEPPSLAAAFSCFLFVGRAVGNSPLTEVLLGVRHGFCSQVWEGTGAPGFLHNFFFSAGQVIGVIVQFTLGIWVFKGSEATLQT
jgi:hypothetical protein